LELPHTGFSDIKEIDESVLATLGYWNYSSKYCLFYAVFFFKRF